MRPYFQVPDRTGANWFVVVMKMAAVCAVGCLLLPSALFAESIRVAYFNAPPYVLFDEGPKKLIGASVEFFEKKIAPAMGVKVIWAEQATSILRQLSQLEQNEFDAGLVFGKNDERSRILVYPRHAFLETSPVLAVLKDHPLKEVKRADDLLGYRIGYTHKAILSPLMTDTRIEMELLSNNDPVFANFLKLLAGRIDAQFQPDVAPILYCAQRLNAMKDIRIIYLPEKTLLYTAFAGKRGKDLARRYDRAFEKVSGASTYLKFLSKYIDIDDLHPH